MSSGNVLINKYSHSRTGRSYIVNNNNNNDDSKKTSHTVQIPTTQQIKKDSSSSKGVTDMQVICEEVGKRYESSLKEYWKKRTNQPYKNILYDQEYKPVTKEEDLIISNTKNIQKISDHQIQEYKDSVEKHNNELNNIYAPNKEQEHWKQFQYNLKHKYRITGPVSADQTTLKNNRIMYYKKEQEKLDQMKEDKEKLFSNLLQNGIFNADEFKECGINV